MPLRIPHENSASLSPHLYASMYMPIYTVKMLDRMSFHVFSLSEYVCVCVCVCVCVLRRR